MKKVCIFIIFLFSFLQTQDFIPENGKVVNYTQIFFRWPQINNAELYTINIIGNNYESINEIQSNSIIISNLNWGTQYSWTICGFENNSLIECYDSYVFSIDQLPDNYPENVNILSLDESFYSAGITMLDYESLNFSVALDLHGNPVWFADRTMFNNSRILVTQFLPSGNIVGFGAGKGYEFNLDSEIIFETPQNLGVHHQIYKTDSTYFIIDAEIEDNPCPEECDFEFPDIIPWQGDIFIEIDKNGNILWEWSTFDYLSREEYNPLWVDAFTPGGGPLDWTHSNSIFLDDESNIVYVSIRNLSRITAIDYFSKDILWNMGNPDFMDEVFFESDYGFSHQHSAQIANNNLLFFDNGRDNNPELSRCVEIEFYSEQDPTIIWEYVLPDSLLTLSRGECDRLQNENTLISVGRTGNVIELNSDDEIVWHLNVKDINGQGISIYRSERIINLYPSSFSFKIGNLEGSYGEYYFLNNNENIHFIIENNGWVSQIFKYEFYNENNILLFEGEVFVLNEDEEEIIENIFQNDIGAYVLKVFPINNSENYQTIFFDMQYMFGDVNGDSEINVLDVVTMINIILYNMEFEESADLNNDDIINILDTVILVNIILDN